MAAVLESLAIAVEHHQAGRLQDAERLYQEILAAEPDQPEALQFLGLIAFQRQQHDIAAEYINRAIALKPQEPIFYNNLSLVFQAQGKTDEAVACCRRALELNPDYVEALFNQGCALLTQWKPGEAADSFRRALQRKPDFVRAWFFLGNAYLGQGCAEEAVNCFRRAVELKPEYVEAYSDILCAIQYQANVSLPGLLEAHREFDRRYAAPLRRLWQPHHNERNPERRLRLGLISPNFRQHPVGHFLIGALERLDREQCETVCYFDWKFADEMTPRFVAAASEWHQVSSASDEELTKKIRTDRIDILFDLAGHTAKNRLLVFARKPAPIQVTWADYVGTTGLDAMDYILADKYEIPAEAEAYYCERVLRMPDGYVTYDPPAYAPPVSPLPALVQGFVTFGSLNDPAKISPTIVEAWAKILGRVPESRLVLKYRGMNDVRVANRLAGEFAGRGIDPQRIEIQGWSAHADFLSEYHRIDLALDSYPYNGGLTTCEALWMGVPVITCPGETFASRHSLSHLSNAGLTETIAADLDQYVELAVSLANDLPRLARLRSGLRDRMAASPLCDGKRFADNLVRLLRSAWREWCEKAEG